MTACSVGAAAAQGLEATPDPGQLQRYPFSLKLVIPAREAATVFEHPVPGGGVGPLNAPSESPIGRNAAERYREFAERLFMPAASPALTLELTKIRGDLEPSRSSGWEATLVNEVRLLAPSGEQLATWRLVSGSPLDGVAERHVPEAFERAAARVVQELESRFEEAAAVRSWLERNGVRPGQVARRGGPPALLAQAPSRAWYDALRPLEAPIGWTEVGGGPVLSAMATSQGFPAQSGVAPSFALRAGVARSLWFAQLIGGQLQRTEGSRQMVQRGFGLDAGVSYSSSGDLILVAGGVGVEWLLSRTTATDWSPQPLSTGRQGWAPSLSASLHFQPRLTERVRLRLGLEYRHRFWDTPGWSDASADSSLSVTDSFTLLAGVGFALGEQ